MTTEKKRKAKTKTEDDSPPPPTLAIETRDTPLDSVQPHPDNPRVGNIDVIERSIRRNGFFGVVIVQKSSSLVLVGNHRRIAAMRAGLTSVPMQWVDCDDEAAKRILLADNRTSDIARYDERKLGELLKSLSRPQLEGTGYDKAKVEAILSRTVTFDASPKLQGVVFSIVVDDLKEAEQVNLLRELEGRGYKVRALMS